MTQEEMMPIAWSSLLVVLAPSLLMLLGSGAVLWVRIPGRLQAATQNFSAGLLISAVAGELFPLMSSPENAAPRLGAVTQLQSTCGICCGFGVGLLFMFGLAHLTGGAEDDEAESLERQRSDSLETPMLTDEESSRAMAALRTEALALHDDVLKLQESISLRARERIDEIAHSMMYRVDRAKRLLDEPEPLDEHNVARMKFHMAELSSNCETLRSQTSVAGARRALRTFEMTLDHIHHHAERVKFRRWNPAPMPSKEEKLSEQLPLPLVFAVVMDAAVDGLLIGLAFAASHSAGWCMSIATCIEMGFLGLSFSATVQNATRSVAKHVSVVLVPPVVLLLSGMSGHCLGGLLEESPGLFIGFIAFSIVALLFLVTQELLSEAREIGGDDMMINVMFFVGLLGGIVLEKVLG